MAERENVLASTQFSVLELVNPTGTDHTVAVLSVDGVNVTTTISNGATMVFTLANVISISYPTSVGLEPTYF